MPVERARGHRGLKQRLATVAVLSGFFLAAMLAAAGSARAVTCEEWIVDLGRPGGGRLPDASPEDVYSPRLAAVGQTIEFRGEPCGDYCPSIGGDPLGVRLMPIDLPDDPNAGYEVDPNAKPAAELAISRTSERPDPDTGISTYEFVMPGVPRGDYEFFVLCDTQWLGTVLLHVDTEAPDTATGGATALSGMSLSEAALVMIASALGTLWMLGRRVRRS